MARKRYPGLEPSLALPDFARAHASLRFERVRQEAARALAKAGDDEIHDLRVAIRRLTQCFRIFPGFFPRKARKEVGAALRQVMKKAGAVRDRDIALELFRQLDVPADSLHRQLLKAEREERKVHLQLALADLAEANQWDRWKAQLELAKGGSDGQED